MHKRCPSCDGPDRDARLRPDDLGGDAWKRGCTRAAVQPSMNAAANCRPSGTSRVERATARLPRGGHILRRSGRDRPRRGGQQHRGPAHRGAGPQRSETASERSSSISPTSSSSTQAVVNVLVRARAVLRRQDRALAVVCPPGPARRISEVAGIADLLALFDTREGRGSRSRTRDVTRVRRRPANALAAQWPNRRTAEP